MFKKVDPKRPLTQIEHEIMEYWKEKDIFRKSLEQNQKKKKFVFFDGPPFANGLPHYGHILAQSLKDAVTRYWSMKGFYVPRTNGWDCHGLPVEYEIEKELNISGKKGIEEYGIDNFNKRCRESVFRYVQEWQKLFERIGRWLDFDQTYSTLENNYMESIWWIFRQIWEKKLVYQGYKAMHICPRCSTPLSNFEVSLGYKEVTDLAVTVKFQLKDEPETYLLAWTTTPWSLLSVMGLAVSKDIEYVKVKSGNEYLILAKKRLEAVFQGSDKNYQIVDEFRGEKILGKAYNHVFDFYNSNPEVLKSAKVFHTVSTDYVSDEDGTGIVTINGAFGDVDMEAAKAHSIPMIVNVTMEGTFTPETGRFAGKFVKTQDQNIANDLEERGKLFKKENYRHSYPHCWRCDTPLLNYATRSWFIEVSRIKEQLLKNNEKINWQPPHIKEGRFGKWLENVRDWSISRNRFWGAAIPVFECEKCGFQDCVSSIDDLSRNQPAGIRLLVVRHAEYDGNLHHTLNSNPDKVSHLTARGRRQALALAKKLAEEKVSVILTSKLTRALETAEILSKKLAIPVMEEPLLNEFTFGVYEGKTIDEYQSYFETVDSYLNHRSDESCETFALLIKRMHELFLKIRTQYAAKTVVLVTHGSPILALEAALGRITDWRAAYLSFHNQLAKNAGTKEFWIGNESLDPEGMVDLHKPYIDAVLLQCAKCSGVMRRIPEVFDCWFESGAMPYAQLHYPFEEKKEFEKNFPAHFIAEGLDQTRGWFYTLHVLASILFDSPAFQNVIVNGILLAADGEKLSKRKKNYPDPAALFESKGVDALRLFLYSSTAPQAEDVRFSDKHVEEVVRKVILTLVNTLSFFVTYAMIDKWQPVKEFKPQHKLDRWILSELQTLIQDVTRNMDEYNLTLATRPFFDFVDNLSNWYVRRSRRRFWKSENDEDKNQAYATLHSVLLNLARLMAPFTPFIAEEIYINLSSEESVHLASWPKADKTLIDKKLNQEMFVLRKIVELGHRSRGARKIKVRQPLAKVLIALPKSIPQPTDIDVLREELNVKEIHFLKDTSEIAQKSVKLNFSVVGKRMGAKIKELLKDIEAGRYTLLSDEKVKIGDGEGAEIFDAKKDEVFIAFEPAQAHPNFEISFEGGIVVALDSEITEDLKNEGICRDLIRFIQEMRKKADYNVDDRIYVFIHTSDYEDIITRYADWLKRETLAIELQQKGNFEWDLEEHCEIDGKELILAVRKA